MSFTDDDLERLKNAIHSLMIQMEKGDHYLNIERHDVNALIARLECAESCIYRMVELDDSIALGSSSDMAEHNAMVNKTREAMDTWLKAAGK